jgi:FAD/FMN-containing dehydrogenase
MGTRTRRGDSLYERRRRAAVWNDVLPDRYPDAIVRTTRREEVPNVVAETGCEEHRIAVKSGGHNWLGACLRDGGILLDLGGLDAVEVDVGNALARVEPGATHKTLADAIVPHGFAFPIGHCPTVGLGGYLLAGGFGWNPRTWGPACWSVQAVDVVTADGEELTITETHHPELFWAARGAGAGFPAIATRFHVRLMELPVVIIRRVGYAAESLPLLMGWAAEKVTTLPEGAELTLIVRRPWSGSDRKLRVLVAATAFGNTRDEAESVLAHALCDIPIQGMPLYDSGIAGVALNELEGDGGWEQGLRYAADTCWVSSGVEEVGRVVEQAMQEAPSDLSRAVIPFGIFPERRVDAALSGLGLHWVNIYATWADPKDDAANTDWARRSMSNLAPWIDGHYIGESDVSAEPGRVRKSFLPANWARLRKVASTYDPGGRLYGFLGN